MRAVAAAAFARCAKVSQTHGLCGCVQGYELKLDERHVEVRLRAVGQGGSGAWQCYKLEHATLSCLSMFPAWHVTPATDGDEV